MKKIGLFVERQRAWGRLLCEGVATLAQTKDDWTLRMIELEDLKCPAALREFDGFVARVPDEKTAAAFRRIQKPVVVFSTEMKLSHPFIRIVKQNTRAIGQLAARHFIEHHFMRFAFCGIYGKRFSDARCDAFVRCLALNHFPCLIYHAPAKTARDFDRSVSHRERFAAGSDKSEMAAWLVKLPKPVGIFCANDLRALQVLETCRAVGFSVPADVAILGVDNDTLICSFSTPMLSSIDPNAFELGRAAAECLDMMLDVPEREICVRHVQPKGLVTRASTEIYPLDPPWLSDALVFIRRNVVR
ncbi:MAG: XylR family transcriptional regulator, partial [Victivallales bacterium]|nr:XylR family transcriptional regulator [Victivallales bacterium]